MAIPKVAIVVDGGAPIGRAVALALAARGSCVVVAGPNERALGETVGEIAFGGGKGRHVVGGEAEASSRALEVFGAVDAVVRVAGATVRIGSSTVSEAQADEDAAARAVVAFFERAGSGS